MPPPAVEGGAAACEEVVRDGGYPRWGRSGPGDGSLSPPSTGRCPLPTRAGPQPQSEGAHSGKMRSPGAQGSFTRSAPLSGSRAAANFLNPRNACGLEHVLAGLPEEEARGCDSCSFSLPQPMSRVPSREAGGFDRSRALHASSPRLAILTPGRHTAGPGEGPQNRAPRFPTALFY